MSSARAETYDKGGADWLLVHREAGIAQSPDQPLPPASPAVLSARLEVLRLLSLLLALPSLLTPPHAFPSLPNRWRDALVLSANSTGSGSSATRTLQRNAVLSLLCSLINTAFGSTSATQPGAATDRGLAASSLSLASGAAERLGGVVLRREDVRGLLTGACLQVLGELLVEHAQATTALATASAGPVEVPAPDFASAVTQSTEPPSRNAFAHFVSKLHRASDFDFLIRGVLSTIERTISSRAETLIPAVSLPSRPSTSGVGATSNVSGWTTEALVVFWRALEGNRRLLNYLVETDKAGELIAWLVMLCLEFKDDESE